MFLLVIITYRLDGKRILSKCKSEFGCTLVVINYRGTNNNDDDNNNNNNNNNNNRYNNPNASKNLALYNKSTL
jgi:hypothetical protein